MKRRREKEEKNDEDYKNSQEENMNTQTQEEQIILQRHTNANVHVHDVPVSERLHVDAHSKEEQDEEHQHSSSQSEGQLQSSNNNDYNSPRRKIKLPKPLSDKQRHMIRLLYKEKEKDLIDNLDYIISLGSQINYLKCIQDKWFDTNGHFSSKNHRPSITRTSSTIPSTSLIGASKASANLYLKRAESKAPPIPIILCFGKPVAL